MSWLRMDDDRDPCLSFRPASQSSLSPFLRHLSAIAADHIVILLVYCLRASFGLPLMEALPSFLALGAVFLLHRIRHNMLLSIGGATVLYMVLLRLLPLL
ncbi:MAG: AzlD domain-containing protein [Merdibacter sp.]